MFSHPACHSPSKIAIAIALSLGAIPATYAAVDTGDIQVQGKSQAGTGFFMTAPSGTVNDIPAEKLNKIQTFNKSASQAQTEITPGQLQMLAPTDSFTQSLANQPNVVVTSDGSSQNGDNVTINGFDKNLINWTLDGVPLNDNDSYTIYTNEFIPTRLISGIKYYPGAASAALPGLAAFGGSVDTYTLDPGPDFSASVLTGYGSFGTYNYGALINSGLLGAKSALPTSFWVYANKNYSKGYFQKTPSDQKQLLFKSITQVGPGALTLFYSRNDQKFNYYWGCSEADLAKYGESCNGTSGEPIVNGKPNTNSYVYRFNEYNNWMGYAKYEATFGKTTLSDQLYTYRGNGYGGGASSYATWLYHPDTNTVSKVATPASGVLIYQSRNDTKRWGNILRMNTAVTQDFNVEAGLWYNHNDTTHDRRYFDGFDGNYLGSLYREPVVTKLWEPYVNLTWKAADALTVQGGLKYLKVHRDFTNLGALAQGKPGQFGVDFHTTMPSIGLNYRINKAISVYANYTQNTQPPQYNQFYTGTYNPNLAPEKGKTYDVGMIYDAGMWTGALDLFRVDFQNYILSTDVYDSTGQQVSMLANAGTALNEGISWQNNFKIDDQWSFYANLGLLNARIKTQDQPFPYAPKHTLSLGGVYTMGPWRATLGAQSVGKSYDKNLNPVDAHTLVDASLRYTLDRGGMDHFGLHKLTVALNASNLLNKHYTYKQAYGSEYRNMPRSFYLSLEAQF
ncbi:TonB-dependent receptor [Halothiobacillus diazotrophicus]|uniref:TonB-dependent receptor n=1 Tax=Halothiobacillus diazotrophicus TaxID=1860122 RepID=A0A191ZE41_9GAMM|nr:TonB-dependent receptor [Halothiobacillus diazotrophicus]ANJ66135.1 TonB-dependent receptor [Halothiobacillus diazotrophicus]